MLIPTFHNSKLLRTSRPSLALMQGVSLVYPTSPMSRRTVVEYLENFERRGSEIACVHRRGYRTIRWSYRDIAQTAFQTARELEARQIGKGERVVIWGGNCGEWIAAFFGCLLRGVVVVPMDRIASADFALRVAQQVDARLLLRSHEQVQLDPYMPALDLEHLGKLVGHHSAEPYRSQDLKRDDPVQVVFTSGTTAEPKGVVISHGNILANIEPLEAEIQKYLKYERFFHPIRFLNLLPLSHVFGQFLGIFVPQLLGGVVIFLDTLNPSEIVRAVQTERVSVLVAVPRLLETLRDKVERDYEATGQLDWFRAQLRNAEGEHFVKRWWRFRKIHNKFGWKFWAFISGGAALDADTEAFWTRLSFVVIQGYGLTETTSMVSVNHPFRLGRGSIGKVLPGREIKLDESGEILLRGESIATGYWQGKELKPVMGQEGWFHTGDMGELDQQGNLYFKGRKKNVIVTPEGMNVYPEDLEAALRHQAEVRDCVVVALSRDGNAEPCAVLILREGRLDPAEVVKRANQSLAEYQRMRRWYVWPEEDFPRTSTQKPRTNVIQEIVHSRLEGKVDAQIPVGSLADLIGRITGRAPAALRADANLATDLNLSSIDRVELLSALEDRFQVDLNESRFSEATTVAELEQMLRQPLVRRTDYKYPRWAQGRLFWLLRLAVYYAVSWPATLIMARPKVAGREYLRDLKGPVLIIANHVTKIDIGFILAALPARFRHRVAVAMIGELLQTMRHPSKEFGLVQRWLNKFGYALVVALFNVFPLPQRTGFRESFAFAGESVDRRYNVLVFPEGRRTQDGNLSPFQAGVGILANNLRIPIVPMRIDGLFELAQSGKMLARPGTVRVTIGAPIRFEPNADPTAIALKLEKIVRELGSYS